MKKLISSLIIVTSLAFASVANAGLITFDDLDSNIADTYSSANHFSTSNNIGSIDYWFNDNFMIAEFNVDNMSYALLDYGFLQSSIQNVYLDSGTNYLFESAVMHLFNNTDKNKTRLGFELTSDLEFSVNSFDLNKTDITTFALNSWTEYVNIDMATLTIQDAPIGSVDVPEPSSLAIFGLAMIGLFGSSVHKRKKS